MDMLFWFFVYWSSCAVIIYLMRSGTGRSMGDTWTQKVVTVILAGLLPWVTLYYIIKQIFQKDQ